MFNLKVLIAAICALSAIVTIYPAVVFAQGYIVSQVETIGQLLPVIRWDSIGYPGNASVNKQGAIAFDTPYGDVYTSGAGVFLDIGGTISVVALKFRKDRRCRPAERLDDHLE